MSTEYISALALMLISVLKIFKVEMTQSELEPIITGLVALVSGVNLLVKRYKRGGITVIGTRV